MVATMDAEDEVVAFLVVDDDRLGVKWEVEVVVDVVVHGQIYCVSVTHTTA